MNHSSRQTVANQDQNVSFTSLKRKIYLDTETNFIHERRLMLDAKIKKKHTTYLSTQTKGFLKSQNFRCDKLPAEREYARHYMYNWTKVQQSRFV